jgi:hypothetical protein
LRGSPHARSHKSFWSHTIWSSPPECSPKRAENGIITEACREWDRRPIAEQNWAKFQVDFAIAHQDLREQLTSGQAGYQSANAAYNFQQETAMAIANLATATASDRSTVANLTSTNNTLMSELAALKIELVATLKLAKPPSRERVSTPNKNYC